MNARPYRWPPGLIVFVRLASVTATITASRPAGADAAPHVGVSLDTQIPAGGVLTGSAMCSPSCDSPLPHFFTSDNQPVGGSFLDEGTGSSGYRNFVFVPEPPLELGTYSVSVTGPFNTATQPFDVVDGTFELPTFTHQVSAETISEGELIQCTEQGQDSVAAWFTLQTRVRPVVSVTVQGLFAKQYQYGLNLSGSEPPWFGASPVTRSFDVVAEELCFQVQGRSYLDEEITKIGEQCVSLEGLGVAVLDEMSGDLRQTLLGCVVPPDGFADDWCALFEAAFAAESCDGFPLDSCFAARRGCSAGDQPSSSQEQDEREDREVPVGVGGTPGAGGFTAAGGGGFESGIGGSPDMRDNGDGPTSHASGGCNIVTMRPFSHAGWLLLIMPLLIGRRLRRF